MKVLVLSDIHGAAAKVERILGGFPPQIPVIFAGDLTHLGGYEQVKRIVEPLLEKNITVFAVPGNMDREGVLDYLTEKKISIHGNGVVYRGIGFFGVGGSNPTPFHTPFELDDKELGGLLRQGYEAVAGCSTTVLVSHAPPYNTKLDKIAGGIHCGSQVVKEFIKMKALTLCLSGHIHESANRDMVGETVCVNVGAVKDNNFCLLELSPAGITISRRKVI
jgi:Icc-related predicted phosphoesterase